ncbi:MAG: hypothetical protein ACOX2W_09775 [Desulfomonilia bacterium]
MNISGIGVIQAQLYQQQQSSPKMLEEILLNKYLRSSAFSPYGKESLRVEIKFTDGTRMTMDYAWEGMARKTGYELSRFGGFTYGTDLFSPENTAQRILDFARSLWDGSEEKLDILARAMEEGMGQALDTLGNIPAWLEAIIGKTRGLVRQGIESMRAEIRGTA